MFDPTPTRKALTMDDLQRIVEERKRSANYQALNQRDSAHRKDALSTLAHYRNLLERSKP